MKKKYAAIATGEVKGVLDWSQKIENNEQVEYLTKALMSEHCKVTSLNLSNNEIENEGIETLTKALMSEHCKVTSLNLSNNEIENEGIETLTKALMSEHCKLTSLDLSYNEIENSAIKAIAKALKHENCKLTSLNLGANEIANAAIKAIAEALKHENCKLTSIVLSGDRISNEGIEAIAEALKHENCKLTSIDLGYNYINEVTALVEALKHENCKLTSINLSNNYINNEGMEPIFSFIDHCINTNTAIKEIDIAKGYRDLLEGKNIESELMNYAICKHIMSNIKQYHHIKDVILKNIYLVTNSIVRYHSEEIEMIKYLVPYCSEYINLKDAEGHSLGYYFSHDPIMLDFLFEHGYIPHGDEIVKKHAKLGDIEGTQTVHDPQINKATSFYIKELKKNTDNKIDVTMERMKFVNKIKHFCNKNFLTDHSKLPLDIFDLSQEQLNDLFKKEANSFTNKSPQEILQNISDTVLSTLTNKYLKAGGGYVDYQYGYKDESKITLGEAIAYVYEYINNKEPSQLEKESAVVDAIKRNLQLNNEDSVKILAQSLNVKKQQINEHKEDSQYWFNIITGENLDDIFLKLTNFILKEFIVINDQFKYMSNIYMAATEYDGEDPSACAPGVVSQIIDVLSKITPEFIAKYSGAQTQISDELTENNGGSTIAHRIAEELANKSQSDKILQKEIPAFIEYQVKDTLNATKTKILTQAKPIFNISTPNIIKFINNQFKAIAPKFLKYFENHIPTDADYKLLIDLIQHEDILKKSYYKAVSEEYAEESKILGENNNVTD